jgi:hypothetical protein
MRANAFFRRGRIEDIGLDQDLLAGLNKFFNAAKVVEGQ